MKKGEYITSSEAGVADDPGGASVWHYVILNQSHGEKAALFYFFLDLSDYIEGSV